MLSEIRGPCRTVSTIKTQPWVSVKQLDDKYKGAVYPKKYAHGFCFAVLCCGYTLTDFPISIRLTSLALWQSNDCPSASKTTLMNMDEYFMWIHYERLHNHNKAKHNKTVCIFLGIYCRQFANANQISRNHGLMGDGRNMWWLHQQPISVIGFLCFTSNLNVNAM